MGRMLLGVAAALGVIGLSLLVGMIFYHKPDDPYWIKAFHRASMILSGMGPVDDPKDDDCDRLFTDLYALFSGIVLALIVGLILTPVFHRVLHHFHIPQGR